MEAKDWKPKERTVKSFGPDGQIETTVYHLEQKKRITAEGVLKFGGVLALITPFLLLYVQRCNDRIIDKQEKLSDTYIQFSKDMSSLMEKTKPDSNYIASFESVRLAFKTKFRLFGSHCSVLYYDSILHFIVMRNAVIQLADLSDSFLVKLRSDSLQHLSKYFINTEKNLSTFFPKYITPLFTNSNDSILYMHLKNYYDKAVSIHNKIRIWSDSVPGNFRFEIKYNDTLFNNPSYLRKVQDTLLTDQKDSILYSTLATSDSALKKVQSFISLSRIRLFNVWAARLSQPEQIQNFSQPFTYMRRALRIQLSLLSIRINELQGKLDACVLDQIN